MFPLLFLGGVETDGGITSKMMVCKRWTPFNYGHFDISMLVCPGGVILSSCSFGLPTAAGMDAVGKWEDFPKKPWQKPKDFGKVNANLTTLSDRTGVTFPRFFLEMGIPIV